MRLSRERAKEIARDAAKSNPPSYYAEPFEPHEWVIQAIIEAYNLANFDRDYDEFVITYTEGLE